MPAVDLTPAVKRWECASGCAVKVETDATTATPLHPCAAHGGFRLPLVPYGSGDHLITVEREDYIGAEDVPLTADGRPIMRTEVERDDGHSDVWVYAATAYLNGEAG